MLNFFRRADQNSSGGSDRLTLNVDRLREDERLELKYDRSGNLIAVQKIKLSLMRTPMEGRAETDIPAGGLGWVFYEGTSWRARCDGTVAIAAGEDVLIMARHDRILLVLPME